MATEQQQNTGTRDRLPNSAHILCRKLVGENRWVVLCVWRKGEGIEFITWLVDEEGNAFHGHYFSDFSEAQLDYTRRITRTF